jgi:uncharacterized protein YbjT (DUF2867 family)
LSDGLTVAIAAANALTGRRLLPRLRELGYRTVALVRRPAELPADEVVAGWMISARAREALEAADFVVLLAGDLRARGQAGYQAVHVRTTQIVAEAMRRGRARRAVYLSYVNADENSANLYNRTKAVAERLLRESGKEALVFRCPAILGSPADPGPLEEAFFARGGRVVMLGDGRQRQRPLYRGDAVEAIVAALVRGAPDIYELAGPEEMTADDLARLVNRGAPVRITHVPGWAARWLARVYPALSPELVDVMLADSVGDATRALTEFGLALTPLSRVWAAAT